MFPYKKKTSTRRIYIAFVSYKDNRLSKFLSSDLSRNALFNFVETHERERNESVSKTERLYERDILVQAYLLIFTPTRFGDARDSVCNYL